MTWLTYQKWKKEKRAWSVHHPLLESHTHSPKLCWGARPSWSIQAAVSEYHPVGLINSRKFFLSLRPEVQDQGAGRLGAWWEPFWFTHSNLLAITSHDRRGQGGSLGALWFLYWGITDIQRCITFNVQRKDLIFLCIVKWSPQYVWLTSVTTHTHGFCFCFSRDENICDQLF